MTNEAAITARHQAIVAAIEILQAANRRSAMVRRAIVRLQRELVSLPICRENFHDRTAAIFTALEAAPTRPADFTSPSGSEYWYSEQGLVRRSDHWMSSIRSCTWYMDGEVVVQECLNGETVTIHGQAHDEVRVGFCRWSDFHRGLGFRPKFEIVKAA